MYKNFFDEITNRKIVSNWCNIQWKNKQNFLSNIQQQIYLSALRGNTSRMLQFQKIILGSLSIKFFAIKNITVENQKKLNNINKIKIALALRINIPQNLYLYWKNLKLSISYLEFSNIYYKSLQFILHLALEPQWEAYLEPDIFGFRPHFFAKDAILTLCEKIQENRFSYALCGSFDTNINFKHQKFLYKKIYTSQNILQIILNFFTLYPNSHDKSYQIYPKLNNLFINILIYGLEYNLIKNTLLYKNSQEKNTFCYTTIYLIRYISFQNHFCILCRTKSLVKYIQQIFSKFFNAINLNSCQEKHKILNNNFELRFIGYVIVKTSKRLNIVPDLQNKKTLIYDIREILYKKDFIGRKRALTYLTLEKAIYKINPLIVNWGNYYNICTQENDLRLMDTIINNTIYRWQIKKYKKNRVNKWKKQCTKYVKAQKRITEGKAILKLLYHQYIYNRDYIPLLHYRSSYDQDIEYWFLRQKL